MLLTGLHFDDNFGQSYRQIYVHLGTRSNPKVSSLSITSNTTCAIVLSSGVYTLGYEYGSYINQHDIVIRFNMAPTEGYEKYVGTRTTHMWTWNAHFDEFLERMDTDEYYLTKLIISPLEWDIASLYKSAIPPARYMIPNQDQLFAACKQHWLQSEYVHRFPTKHCSSEAFSIAYCLQECTQVNVFGFYPGHQCDVPIHYFEAKKCSHSDTQGVDAHHNFTYEHIMLESLSRSTKKIKILPPLSGLQERNLVNTSEFPSVFIAPIPEEFNKGLLSKCLNRSAFSTCERMMIIPRHTLDLTTSSHVFAGDFEQNVSNCTAFECTYIQQRNMYPVTEYDQDVFFHRFLQKWVKRVYTPSEADLIFIPIYRSRLFCHASSKRLDAIEGLRWRLSTIVAPYKKVFPAKKLFTTVAQVCSCEITNNAGCPPCNVLLGEVARHIQIV